MTEGTADVSRRGFLRMATAGAGAAVASGVAAGQEDGNGTATPGGGNGTPAADGEGTATPGGNGGGGGDAAPPDYEGWFSSTDNYDDTTEDLRGQSEATVMVGTEGNGGPNAFSPPAIHVDPGTTVLFEWTGDGVHNVVEESEAWSSGGPVGEAGVNYERTFEEEGIQKYFCEPHETNGMFGAVVVGQDYPTADTGGGDGGPALPDVAKSLGVAASVVMAATLGLAYVFIRHGGSRQGGD